LKNVEQGISNDEVVSPLENSEFIIRYSIFCCLYSFFWILASDHTTKKAVDIFICPRLVKRKSEINL
jgi:hypothetical protein